MQNISEEGRDNLYFCYRLAEGAYQKMSTCQAHLADFALCGGFRETECFWRFRRALLAATDCRIIPVTGWPGSANKIKVLMKPQ